MLFNSFAFFLVFLPLCLSGYFVLSKYSIKASIVFLLLASVCFYGYWSLTYLPLLLGSIAINYGVGGLINHCKGSGNESAAKYALILGLVLNLGALFFFKYFDFLVVNVGALMGQVWLPAGIILPIGISFFTFTQIAYLVDCKAGKVSACKAENYGLFVTYFPHLIAGPIIHHKDMMPQFVNPATHVFSTGRLTLGLLIFAVGLFKKIVLADGVAVFVGPVFDVHYASLTMAEAWVGVLAYTFQLYFDFSGYCDMAYGLSYMFGVVLPINFNSPYKARSIIDFWRRWHITLSSFLKDYLYVPLGGNRRGRVRRYLNLVITMLLGGLWHGANWTFIVWGALHGVYLIANHALRHLVGTDVEGRERCWANGALMIASGVCITFLAVVLAWVFFRASSVSVALGVLKAMYQGTHTLQPGNLAGLNRIMNLHAGMLWVLTCASIAFLTPTIYDVLERGKLLDGKWHLQAISSEILFGFLLVISLLLLAIGETRGVSEFLYFNF